MQLDLIRGRFLRRYKRFFADVELPGGEVVTAHCPNTGSMATLLNEDVDAYLAHSADPKRKLAWTLTILGLPRGGLALIDTQLPNRIVEEGVEEGTVPELRGYGTLEREVPYGERSRVDLLLRDPVGGPRRGYGQCFVEIKSVTMMSRSTPARGDFPDSPTERGKKHLRELAKLARCGVRVVQFFLLGRTDCRFAGVAAEIDPGYAGGLARARAAGVEVLAYRVDLSPTRVVVGRRCPFVEELETALEGA